MPRVPASAFSSNSQVSQLMLTHGTPVCSLYLLGEHVHEGVGCRVGDVAEPARTEETEETRTTKSIVLPWMACSSATSPSTFGVELRLALLGRCLVDTEEALGADVPGGVDHPVQTAEALVGPFHGRSHLHFVGDIC